MATREETHQFMGLMSQVKSGVMLVDPVRVMMANEFNKAVEKAYLEVTAKLAAGKEADDAG